MTRDECERAVHGEALEEALNAAVSVIQAKLGVDDGGWASHWFADNSPPRKAFDDLMIAYARSEGDE